MSEYSPRWSRTVQRLIDFAHAVIEVIEAKVRIPVLRDNPNPYHHPDRPSVHNLRAGTKLFRIFDLTYNALDFNPRGIEKDKPHVRGRFTATRSDPYASMYVGAGDRGPNTALWELLEFEGVDVATGNFLLPPRLVAKYALVELETTRPVRVANIRNQDELLPYRAKFGVITGPNYRTTRAWARYIRRSVTGTLDGLRYFSVRSGYANALILFESLDIAQEQPRTSPRTVKQIGDVKPLSASETQIMIAEILGIKGIG